jgi:hypothetical protein
LGAEFASVADSPPIWIPIGISLQFRRTRVIYVIAVITAQGERNMNGIPAETANTEAGAPAEQPPPAQKPRSVAQKAHVALSRATSGKEASPAKKANKGAKSAKSPKKATGARQGSKTAKVLAGPQRTHHQDARFGGHRSLPLPHRHRIDWVNLPRLRGERIPPESEVRNSGAG